MNYLLSPDMTTVMKTKTLSLSVKISALLFAFLLFLLSYFSVSAKIDAVESKITIDTPFLINALKIGDYFFIIKYVSALSESGVVSYASIRDLKDGELITESPQSDGSLKHQSKNIIPSLRQTSFLREKKLFLEGREASWILRYRVDVSHYNLITALFLSLSISLLILFLLRATLQNIALYFSQPIQSLVQDINQKTIGEAREIGFDNYGLVHSFRETDVLVKELNGMVQKIFQQQDEIKEAEVLRVLNQLSRQVAHDIKSPIGAIKTALDQLQQSPEKSASLLKRATSRIEEIVRDLSIKDIIKTSLRFEGPPTNISDHIQDVILEKKSSFSKIEIDFNKPPRPVFIAVNSGEFKRALSNIINNAYEAYEANASFDDKFYKIEIDVHGGSKYYELTIQDFGPGIPSEFLSRVTERGFTRGKKLGQGQGLSHASEMMESLCGQLVVQSNEPRGTCIKLQFLKEVV